MGGDGWSFSSITGSATPAIRERETERERERETERERERETELEAVSTQTTDDTPTDYPVIKLINGSVRVLHYFSTGFSTKLLLLHNKPRDLSKKKQ